MLSSDISKMSDDSRLSFNLKFTLQKRLFVRPVYNKESEPKRKIPFQRKSSERDFYIFVAVRLTALLCQ